ncbi:hypothetical protein EDB81DRAFT_840125 [Dactylonectria macrodidyma]|uniref:Major facilitator superfamily (MFS) profile domain-containing protein n=1 Tax=Dactylonectria macrodidyma TaxID=307937 RepID=A0A9P9JHP8_9HYPO|nr:hypothetical protein EDB81DRAFT_840125 [Dactylonectria macrodidyma]
MTCRAHIAPDVLPIFREQTPTPLETDGDGPVLGLASFLNYFSLSTTGLDSTQGNHLIGGLLIPNNCLFAGSGIISCLLVPWLLDAAGRRTAIQITSLICVLSAAPQAGSVHTGMLLIGRFLKDIGVGMMDVVVPIYQSEISPANIRGRMVRPPGFLVVLFLALAGWAGYGCFFITNLALQWRRCFAFQIIVPFLLLVGNTTAARQVLEKLHPDSQGNGHSFADNELQGICAQLEMDTCEATSEGWRQVFSKKSYHERILHGFFFQYTAQSTSILDINNYQILLYNSLACYNSLAAFINFINSLILDHSSSIDASSYVYYAKIFLTSIRAHGVGISISSLFIITLIYMQTTSTAFKSVRWKFYFIFIILPWVGALVISKYFPETAGLSLAVLVGDDTAASPANYENVKKQVADERINVMRSPLSTKARDAGAEHAEMRGL